MRQSKWVTGAWVLATAAYGGNIAESGLAHAADQPASAAARVPQNPLRDAYFGDLHLHTSYSFDAYVLMGSRHDPETAYRFARGEPVEYLGQMVQRREPLDFLAVTDHSENIGVFNELENPNGVVSKSTEGKMVKEVMGVGPDPKNTRIGERFYFLRDRPLPASLAAISASAWEREVSTANRFYDPGKFTSFIAYEWTSMPGGANLHRNVIFKGDSAPTPFSSVDSTRPEDLWAWLEKIRKHGYEALAIPHNGNASNGLMYDWTTIDGRPIDRAYAELRRANELLNQIRRGEAERLARARQLVDRVIRVEDFAQDFGLSDALQALEPASAAGDRVAA